MLSLVTVGQAAKATFVFCKMFRGKKESTD